MNRSHTSRWSRICVLALSFMFPAWIIPEPTASATHRFEVASMRESSPSEMHVSWNSYTTNRVYYHNQALDVILGDAFDQNNLYIDGPAWLKEQRYDIEVKIDGDVLLPRGTVRPMLQTLLQQHLRLAAHREIRAVSGYELVTAKSTLRLSPSRPDDKKFEYIFKNQIRIGASDLDALAGCLESAMRQPVLNKTNVSGRYNVELEYSVDPGCRFQPARYFYCCAGTTRLEAGAGESAGAVSRGRLRRSGAHRKLAPQTKAAGR